VNISFYDASYLIHLLKGAIEVCKQKQTRKKTIKQIKKNEKKANIKKPNWIKKNTLDQFQNGV
jgi:hypothetical protein